jgi:hypothetical protein
MSKIPFSDFVRATNADEGVSHNRPLRTLVQAAADSQNHALIRQINSTAKRFGLTFICEPDQEVDAIKLNRDLSASRASTTERIALKTALGMLGVLR